MRHENTMKMQKKKMKFHAKMMKFRVKIKKISRCDQNEISEHDLIE